MRSYRRFSRSSRCPWFKQRWPDVVRRQGWAEAAVVAMAGLALKCGSDRGRDGHGTAVEGILIAGSGSYAARVPSSAGLIPARSAGGAVTAAGDGWACRPLLQKGPPQILKLVTLFLGLQKLYETLGL